jgi:NADPH:quinone reductase-like Zn-dependent oxidoreductase
VLRPVTILITAALAFSTAAQPFAESPPISAPTMKAVRIHQTGGPDVLQYEDAPRPAPGEGELLVRVYAAGVNPVDAKFRQGNSNLPFPFTLGFDISGSVESVGSGVTRFKAGDAVFAYLSLRRGGGYAQYALVRESEAAPKPATIDFPKAAAVPLAALTAWQALIDNAKLEKGQNVLIHGGSGGVGSFAVQIAKSRGARVLATASTKNLDLLRELGADTPIDYTAAKFEEIAKDMDIVLDTVGGETQSRSWGVLKKGGVLVSIVGPVDQNAAKEHGARGVAMMVKPDTAELAQIGTLIDEGKIKPVLSQVLRLEDARKAHELIESKHTRGKIVLRVADDSDGGHGR